MARLQLDLAAQLDVGALDNMGSLPTQGIKNVVAVGLQPAVASVLGKGRTHRSGLDLCLKLGDQFALPLRFPVHGVL